MLQEVVLCALCPSPDTASGTSGLLALHDVQTGTPLVSFKQTNAAPHSLAYVESTRGRGGVVLAAQADKAVLHVFSFQKDQLMSRIILPEKVSCMALDPTGDYCACGTANGRLYLWEVASGILYNSFEAHFRRISVMRFTHDGAGLVTASDDSIVNVWSMSRLLDDDLQAEMPTPYCSLTDHTLPITDVICGVGLFPSCRIFTSSLDSSVKLWDLSTSSLLTSFLFPRPITTICVDPSERFIFAASRDGSIQQVNLFRKRSDIVKNTRAFEAIGGGGMELRLEDEGDETSRLINVGQPVTALTLSVTAALLLVGVNSGQIQIYDVASHQLLRSINTYHDKGFIITTLATFLKPPDLYGHVRVGDGGVSAKDTDPVRPVASFQRTKDASAREMHEVNMLLSIQNLILTAPVPTTEELLQEHRYFIQDQNDESAASGGGTSLQSRVVDLEAEVADLREQLGKAKGLNDAMWEGVVQKMLDRLEPMDVDVDADKRSRKRRKAVDNAGGLAS